MKSFRGTTLLHALGGVRSIRYGFVKTLYPPAITVGLRRRLLCYGGSARYLEASSDSAHPLPCTDRQFSYGSQKSYYSSASYLEYVIIIICRSPFVNPYFLRHIQKKAQAVISPDIYQTKRQLCRLSLTLHIQWHPKHVDHIGR